MMFKKFSLILLLFSMPCMAVEKVTVIGLFKDKAIVEIDGKQRVLNAGQTSPEGVKLISASSREAVLEIDGNQDTYTLGAGTMVGGNFAPPAPGVTTAIAPDNSGHYFVNGSINGFQVNFVVDTGATLISMNRNHARRIGLNYKLEGRESRSSTAAGIATIYLMNLSKVMVGEIELQNVEGAIHDSDFPEVILLGNSFLSRVKMFNDGTLLKLEKK
jgi:aspartyl protease family protein